MIEATGLNKRFGSIEAARDVSFVARDGEITGLLGANGAGKSTCLRMLYGVLTPDGGKACIDGIDIRGETSKARAHLGVLPHATGLYNNLTARENMDLHAGLYGVPRKLRCERIKTLLTTFELWDHKDRPVNKFSGGMRRRLEIARGLLHTPKILFLDEPTLGLDPQSRNQLWEHVRTLNHQDGVTVFLTTHYMDEAERTASRIAIIDHGRIVALGTSTELKEKTRTETLQDAFLALTGTALRDEIAGPT